MVDTMVRQGMTNYYLGNEVGVMDKKRWIAWALALFMVATPCMTFAQEISGAAGSTKESESNEPVNPDKASEPDCGDAVENEKGDSSAESVKGSEEDATGEQDSAKEKRPRNLRMSKLRKKRQRRQRIPAPRRSATNGQQRISPMENTKSSCTVVTTAGSFMFAEKSSPVFLSRAKRS